MQYHNDSIQLEEISDRLYKTYAFKTCQGCRNDSSRAIREWKVFDRKSAQIGKAHF